jgi:L-ribulose-5-phosphate 4-epimerase
LLPAMGARAAVALLARALWREGYGRDPDAGIVARDGSGARRSTPFGIDWRRLVGADIECGPDAHGTGPALVELRDRPRYGALWAAIGEIPPPMDQSSSAGGGVPGVHLCIAPDGVIVVRGETVRSVHERAVAFEARCRHAWMVRAAGKPLDTPLPAAYRATRELLDGNGFVGFWEAMVRQELRADPGLLATLTEET